MSKKKFSLYKEHPKKCRSDDFWSQVKRTVNGQPVSQDQIDMIVEMVVTKLELNLKDNLLDLCCGNGALSTQFLKECNSIFGVDISEHLIKIANMYFAKKPNEIYVLGDVVDFCSNPISPESFNKAVCYGSFSYLDFNEAESVLKNLKRNFPNLDLFFIGNYPDKNYLTNFYGETVKIEKDLENNPYSSIGIWRTPDEFISLANQCGWKAEVSKMPDNFYASYYRYDAILSR